MVFNIKFWYLNRCVVNKNNLKEKKNVKGLIFWENVFLLCYGDVDEMGICSLFEKYVMFEFVYFVFLM